MDRESIMQAAQIHLVVATLIMTVTFTAGFTLPGAVAVFTYFAMAASAISVTELPVVMRLYKFATFLQLVAMSAVVIAFVTGMYATLAHSVGLAVTVCIIGCISFVMCLWVTYVLGSKT
ncbi:hypothetical protein MTR67_025061 [Solanum verrucosum]|uniref:PGG domain-containing protein n=1 Tax=Solanum verrucosum TaxID=315347 RepID=A0AAF0R4A9_SOLVR|nr:hypothetical protein MTR67_025061 [Solanum verrucosum]